MPTDEEWTELRNSCTWTWTNDYNGTGVAGGIVTSNVSGYTDKSIFLPAAGTWDETYLNSAGSDGRYWSSSLDVGNNIYAWHVLFRSVNVYKNYGHRFHGFPVRPVSE